MDDATAISIMEEAAAADAAAAATAATAAPPAPSPSTSAPRPRPSPSASTPATRPVQRPPAAGQSAQQIAALRKQVAEQQQQMAAQLAAQQAAAAAQMQEMQKQMQEQMQQQMQQQMQLQMQQMQQQFAAQYGQAAQAASANSIVIRQIQHQSAQEAAAASSSQRVLTVEEMEAAEAAKVAAKEKELELARTFKQHTDMASGSYGRSPEIRNSLIRLHKQFGAVEQFVQKRIERHNKMRKGIKTLAPDADPAKSTFHNHPQFAPDGVNLLDGVEGQPLLADSDFIMTKQGFERWAKELLDAYWKTVTDYDSYVGRLAGNLGVQPLHVPQGGYVGEDGNKKRRRDEFCNCSSDSCHNSRCKCVRAGIECRRGCACFDRVVNGARVCQNMGNEAPFPLRLRAATASPAAAAALPLQREGQVDHDLTSNAGDMFWG